jgi:signal transduction histidine kinase
MRALADALGHVNVFVFAAIAFVCLRQWHRRRDEPARWAALTFALLGAVALAGEIIDAFYGEDGAGVWMDKILVALIALFPYLLFRFGASLSRPRREIELAAVTLTAVVFAWAFFVEIPEEGTAWPAAFTAFIAALLTQWTLLSFYVALRLWRAGDGQPTVVRYRVRLLSFAAIALSVVLIVAGAGGGTQPAWLELTSGLLTLVSAFTFFVGFAPPLFLREIWRRPERSVLREGIDELLRFAATPPEIAARVLPRMARVVGARGVGLLDEKGAVLGTHGIEPAAMEQHEREPEVVRLPLTSGSLVIWTNPYAPFFGEEEFALLRALGSMTMLALESSRLFAQEREARVALEEADEMKSQFIALASHELRTPAAVIHGIASTLQMRGEELERTQLLQLRRTLYEQTDRLRRLVDQLLDLSRLEAHSVHIDPKPLWVRSRVEEVILMVAGERAKDIDIAVPSDLQTIVDPDAFDRVVSNLIVNALRYGEAPIRVFAEQPDRYFRLSVEDRGGGVPPEFVPQLFERFTRSRKAPDATGGAGLGLAIAQSYAQAHGGDLLYEEAEPHGACFKLVLPAKRPQPGGLGETSAAPSDVPPNPHSR